MPLRLVNAGNGHGDGARVQRLGRRAAAGLRAFVKTFRSSRLDLDRLRSFRQPVYFALGGRSNPDDYGEMAGRACEIFLDFTADVFTERRHFDPPHRIEPERTAREPRAHWAGADG